MATISLCMIVKDEAGFLENCLASMKDIVDEMIIVDTGSSDTTKEIAKQHGAQVFDLPWKEDFSLARNFSLEKATSNWILVLDADEMLDAQGKKEILALTNKREHCLSDIIGFKLNQRTYIQKSSSARMTVDPLALARDYSTYNQSKLVRLFKNHPKIRFKNKVHELVEESIRDNSGKIIETDIAIHHFSSLKKSKIPQKAEQYTDILWKQLEADPENPRYNRQVAQAFMDRGQYDLALKYFTRTVKYESNFPGIFADLGVLFAKMQQPVRSIKYFNMAIAQNKKDTESLNNLAVIYMSMGKYDLAEKLLHTALAVDEKCAPAKANYELLKQKKSQRKK